jgi:nicotinate-nucleotide adenylyltransferase
VKDSSLMTNDLIRLGIFGGSFDPPHLGHVLGCLWALCSGEIDRVVMIPVGRHAFGKESGAGFEDRLEMCRLATQHLGGFVEVSDLEGRRDGTSYTIETLEALRKERPQAQLRLIVGSDVASEVNLWRSADQVLEIAPLLELPRPGKNDLFSDRPEALPNISSTFVREVLRHHGDLGYLIPAVVKDYVLKKKLYR